MHACLRKHLSEGLYERDMRRQEERMGWHFACWKICLHCYVGMCKITYKSCRSSALTQYFYSWWDSVTKTVSSDLTMEHLIMCPLTAPERDICTKANRSWEEILSIIWLSHGEFWVCVSAFDILEVTWMLENMCEVLTSSRSLQCRLTPPQKSVIN